MERRKRTDKKHTRTGIEKNTKKSVRPKKSLGQNFLMHQSTAERIAESADLTSDDTVFEIGPGTGKLTRALLARAGKVIAVEADGELLEQLREAFASEISEGRFELVHADIREFNIAQLPDAYKIVANIPYYLTGELMRRFLESDHQPSSITFLVQKEVAERIARSKKESILSLSIKIYGTPKYVFTVPRGAFQPIPNVDSAVLSVRNISKDAFSSPEQETLFFTLIRAGFAHKRKLLRSNLAIAGFETVSIPEKIRAEDLELKDWILLMEAVS